MNFRIIYIIILIAACASSILLVLPTINDNIGDPNLIAYFNADEGYLTDLIWSYYSLEKRPSYQMDLDYGLEMVYLSDLARIIFSKFINFTPGTFVLILRWIHLFAWVGALIALWILIGRHFGKGWQQALPVLLLWSRPSFNYFIKNLKPDFIVLFLVITGLNYTLKIVENPSRKYLLISVACASLAFLIKFGGIFLLPAIACAIYLAKSYNSSCGQDCRGGYFYVKNAWVFPAVIGLIIAVSPFLGMFCYIRKATGLTYYEEFGIWRTVSQHGIILLFWLLGAIFMIASLVLFRLRGSRDPRAVGVFERINGATSCFLVASALFSGFVLLFGMRWITMPAKFIETYAIHVVEFGGGEAMRQIGTSGEFIKAFMWNIVYKLTSFDALMLLFLIGYIAVEAYAHQKKAAIDSLKFYKRMVLLIYLAPLFISIFSIGRFTQHHMLPFFIAVAVLSVQAIRVFIDSVKAAPVLKKAVVISAVLLLMADITVNATVMISDRTYQYRKNEDAALEAAGWLYRNVPLDANIAADFYTSVYVPPQYEGVKTFRKQPGDKVEQFRSFIEMAKPRFVYYNMNTGDIDYLPPLEKILPNKKTRLLKSFSGAHGQYRRKPQDEFVIYEIID